ncbi:mucin-5AC [Anopheles maculipalpis]|uniref:mucin-5AC n=1 Tax=Anopheles maculipalpis TaxID=1496333 RepID=UPI00215963E3|nr:mucin-5AC [Anopheles maculipalpis]
MQQVDDPPYLTVGTEVSAKYKGAFCEAKVRKVVRNIKCKVAYKQQGLGSGVVSDDQIKGALRVGATVEVKHPERKEYVEATLTKIQDCSQYTVVFDDGDITTLRRSALCLKSGRHFNESETLDQLPLTHPEHFGNPVIGGRRGRRSRHLLPDESSDEEDEPTHHSRSNASDKEENIGKVVCVETSDNKKKNPKENWFPGLVVAPTAQDTVRIRVKDEYLVRSFKDGRYYTVPKKEATEFTRDSVNKSEAAAVSAAIEYMDNDVLPPHWDREALFGTSGSCSDSDQELETDSSDDEPTEEKDHFVAQLYKFMDDRGTPLNKAPSITNRDVDLYRLFRAVQKLHGYNRVTTLNQWKQIALRLGFSPATASITNLVKQAYKKFLFSFEEFNRKLGCTMVPHPKTSRTKGRSLVRASSVQSPKLTEKEKLLTAKEKAASAAAADASAKASSSAAAAAAAASTATEASNSAVEESGNTSESSAAESAVLRPSSTKRKAGVGGKVKALVDKFEEKEKEREKEKVSTGKGGGESSGSSGGGKKDDAGTSSSASAVKKEKPTPGKAKSVEPVVVEKRGRKRKDADSVDSKKDDRETATASSSVGSAGSTTSSLIKPEKQPSSSSRKEESGGPPGREGNGGGGGGGGVGGNGTGPGTASGHSVRNVSPAVGAGSTVPDFPIEVGDKLKVYYDEQKVTYEAKVIEIAKQEGNLIYLVHYTGWNTRYDEWVRKERIAENLTNSKTKKGKSSTNTPTSGSGKGPTHGGTPGASIAAGDKTPKIAKRSRGNSKGEQSSSGPGSNSTPRSTTPNVGRNKSPATPSNRRPLTRGGSSAATGSSLSASAASAGRRTSNNTDISSSLSVPTDPDNTSDTDSDEPMLKKCTTNSTSSTTSSNSSISISSTSTKVSTTAEAGSSSDAAAISDEFSNGASKGGGVGGVGGGGGGRDYDLNQIRSELKGFKELKSPGSPASDTTTTTTTTAGGAGESHSTSVATITDVPKHLIPKQEPTSVLTRSSSIETKDLLSGNTPLAMIKKEPTGSDVIVKEEESTVTEEDDEPEKSSESETLSEEDSSQSSNKAYSSSPITTMVDSDTAETPLAAGLVLSPKILASPPPSVECEDTSSTEPLISVANKAADAKASLEKASALNANKKDPSDASSVEKSADASSSTSSSLSSSSTGGSKPPIKTYGTAATIIANSEKMAFCTVRDASTENDLKSPLSVTTATAKDSVLESPQKTPLGSQTAGTSASLSVRSKAGLSEDKTPPSASSGRTGTSALITPTKAAFGTSPSGPSGSNVKDDITVSPQQQGVIIATGSNVRPIKSPKSSPSTNATESSSGTASEDTKPSTATVPPIGPTANILSQTGNSTVSAFSSLRAEKKQTGTGMAGTERKFTLGREGTSAFSTPVSSQSTLSVASSATSLKHGSSGLLGEKKHFSSSTLTPAQNKLLSKEALCIKSLFESAANEKISDVYEFEDEYDDQDTASSSGPMGVVGGTGGSGTVGGGATGPRKLVSDVPPAEVVSSLTPSLGGQQADEKRKKPLQRKTMAATAVDPLDTSNYVSGGYSGALKRAKKPSPVKTEPMGVSESKPPKGPGALRREAKEKEEKDKEQKPPLELDSGAVNASVDQPKEKISPKTTAAVTTSAQPGLTTAFVQTPVKSDSTFDVLRKSPSFNLVTPGPLGAKEEGTFKSQEELDTKPTPPPLPATTTPGIFTPVISASSAGSGGVSDRSISSVLYPHGKGPSTSVLLAKAGDESQKEEPTLENCKKYFNDMNFEFDAPNVKKPPSIADKVLKALSQQNQQQQQQTIKSEKPDFPKYMPSSMHHHSLPSTPKSLMSSGLLSSPAMESGTPMSFTSSLHPAIKSESISGGGNSSSTVSYTSPMMAVNHPAKPASLDGNESLHGGKTLEGMKKEPEDSHVSTTKSSPISTDIKATNPPQTTITTSSSHKIHSLEQIPTSRSNDLTESLRKLDPDPRFIHDDESTDSNDSEHRLIIEDAESQGSGEPVTGSAMVRDAHPVLSNSSTIASSTTAVIVHYESKQPAASVISAKKELFEEKPRSAPTSSSITLEMASAASAAAVAAVADKEKLILKQDRPGTTENLPSSHVKEDPAKSFSGAPTASGDKKTSGGAKQSLLETIIQMNTASRGMSSEEYLMEVLKVHEQQPQTQRTSAEADNRKDGSSAAQLQQDNSGVVAVTASVITTTGSNPNESLGSSVQSLNQDDVPSQSVHYHQSQSPAQAPNNESLSLLLCEETIPGSPAPKDQDRLPPSTVGRKVYAETPLVPTSVSSSFLPPQNIQTATDLKPVPMDLEPPVVTITIGGNTTISSTSQSGQTTAVAGSSNLQQQHQHQQQQSLRSKISSGGGESTADTPNSSPRDSVSQDETHDQESLSPMKKRRQRKPSEEPTLKRRRTGNTSLGGGYGYGNNGSNTSYGRNQRGLNTSNATDSEDNSDNLAAFHRSSSLIFVGSKTGRPCQYNFLVNLDPSLSNNQRIGIIRKKIQDLRKTYNAIKAELASIDRRRKKLRRRERENKKQAKLNSASVGNN